MILFLELYFTISIILIIIGITETKASPELSIFIGAVILLLPTAPILFIYLLYRKNHG